MKLSLPQILLYGAILIAGFAAPVLFPGYTFAISGLWVFILFAMTWDIMGGQMGYNSLGNIFFFGIGMYVCAIVQVGLYYNVAAYTAPSGAVAVHFTPHQYYVGLTLGLIAASDHRHGFRLPVRTDHPRAARAVFRHRHARHRAVGG